jgi:hypothetical protein
VHKTEICLTFDIDGHVANQAWELGLSLCYGDRSLTVKTRTIGN